MVDQRPQPILHEALGFVLHSFVSKQAKEANLVDTTDGAWVWRFAVERACLLSLREAIRETIGVKQTMADAGHET